MSTAEIKEMAASVKQNLLDEPDWDKVTAGVLMSVSFNDPKSISSSSEVFRRMNSWGSGWCRYKSLKFSVMIDKED